MSLKPHKLAELLPLMSEPEYQALKADIDAHGQRDAIILLDGKILDGRNRERACRELKIQPRCKDFRGDEVAAVAFVYSKAVHRNMTDSQKAAAAVNFLPHFEKAALARMISGGCAPVPEGATGRSDEKAGSLFGVSGRYVQLAKHLFTSDPTLFADVFAGKLPLTQAVRRTHSARRTKELARKAKAAPPVGGCEIHAGDCIAGMEAMAAGSVDLIFADPPYNIGVDYGDGGKADRRTDYVSWCHQWIDECGRVLKPGGSIWVLINDENAARFAGALEGWFVRRAWVKWYETFGVNCHNNFNRTSRHLFYCVKEGGDFVFNSDAFTRASDRQTKYQDKRAAPGGKLWDDVWQIPRLVENASERVPGFPTQLPLALVEPVVLGCSEPGQTVLDPFTGSGTTAVAACRNGRKFIGFEQNKQFAALADQRVRAACAAKSDAKPHAEAQGREEVIEG